MKLRVDYIIFISIWICILLFFLYLNFVRYEGYFASYKDRAEYQRTGDKSLKKESQYAPTTDLFGTYYKRNNYINANNNNNNNKPNNYALFAADYERNKRKKRYEKYKRYERQRRRAEERERES